MEYVANENEKDRKMIAEEKETILNQLTELKKANQVVATLAKVSNKIEWANTIK